MPIKRMLFQVPSPLHEISFSAWKEKQLTVYVKRDDLIHEIVQGNKWRKLKYNIEEAKQQSKNRIVTMGGPWSNHLAAVAATCKFLGLNSMAYIRGVIDEENYSDTLKKCIEYGMELKMMSRLEYDYQKKSNYNYLLNNTGINDLFIPEGGSNANGIKGCIEIRNEIQVPFDYVISAIGSGTTAAGLALACNGNEKVLGVNVFKTDTGIKEMIAEKIRLLEKKEKLVNDALNRLKIIDGFSFGGFARTTSELEDFRLSLYKDIGIDTDLVYTAKVFYAVNTLIDSGFFKKEDKIVVLHTGGIQGNQGFQHKINRIEKK